MGNGLLAACLRRIGNCAKGLSLLSCVALTVLMCGGSTAIAVSDSGDSKLRQVMELARQRAQSPEARPPSPPDPQRLSERSALLAQAERALARSDVDAALHAFDRAAMILHAADTEMGLVRAYMQSGEYRRALAFVSHTAAAHRDVAGGSVLYAWLLHAGGQRAAALRVLDEFKQRSPAEPLAIAAHAELSVNAPLASGRMLEAPARLAPYGSTAGLPATARVVGTGVLLGSGDRVLAPLASMPTASRVWVRNGVGELRRARLERRSTPTQLAVLRLDDALPADQQLKVASRDPFPGSIGYTVEYVASADAVPRWPILHSGFIGMPTADGAHRELGIDVPAGARGGPVFDAQGNLTGIAVPVQSGTDRVVTVSQLRDLLGPGTAASATLQAGARAPVDQIYESALKTAVQIISGR